jgi:hypothetical protein
VLNAHQLLLHWKGLVKESVKSRGFLSSKAADAGLLVSHRAHQEQACRRVLTFNGLREAKFRYRDTRIRIAPQGPQAVRPWGLLGERLSDGERHFDPNHATRRTVDGTRRLDHDELGMRDKRAAPTPGTIV